MHHPIPFIGIESGKKGHIHTFKEAYEFLSTSNDVSHPGHPVQPTTTQEPCEILPFNLFSPKPYSRSSSNHVCSSLSVVEVNKLLYFLTPSLNGITLDNPLPYVHGSIVNQCPYKKPYYYQDLKSCVGIICRELVKASNKLQAAIPVRISFDYNEPYKGAPTQWATMLTFFDDTKVLLPLSLSLRGQQTMRFPAPDQYFH